MPKELKRWTLLDTINATLLIIVVLFILDFKNNALVSWIFVAVFIFWAITVIARNVIITKIKNGEMEDPRLSDKNHKN